MKTRHFCILLILSVLCFLLSPFLAQADEDDLEWVDIDKPGLSGNIVVTSSEVSEIAVGARGTIYALDNENSVVYKSLNAGATWEDITSYLTGVGAGLPASKIAIAPDTTGTVAVVTDSGTEVYLSTDGGNTWSRTYVPSLAGTIQTITISKQYVEADISVREIAIGTAQWGDNTTTGQVWLCQIGKPMSSWQNQDLTVDLDTNHVGGEVSAIAYSPNYQRDNTIIVVASTSTGSDVADAYRNKTWLCIGKRNTAAGTTSWDAFSGYPVEIATTFSPSAGDAPDVSSIYSSLAVPSNYSSHNELSRQLFVSYDRAPNANDDVYRFDDTTAYRLNTNGGAAIDISSIAYYGTTTSGKLLAGDVSPVDGSPHVQVRRTTNPWDSVPTWQLAGVPPSGPGNAKVSWSPEGDLAYCGTGQNLGAGDDLDESAFSVSSDDGNNWQQLSLIDTTIMLSDIAPAPDSKTLFVATYSDSGPEGIWRSASTRLGIGEYWSRQLTMETSPNRIILRLSPDYTSDYTIYAAEVGGNLMAVSHNRGNSWKWCRAPAAVIDMVIEDENTIYVALPGGYITKSTNGAWFWSEPVHAVLPDINMLAIAEKGTILVGGRNGQVAYSTDGGASFARIYGVIGSGDVQVVADTNYQENGIIYATTDAPDKGIWRCVIGLSTSWEYILSANWEQIDESITALKTGQRIGGLAMSAEGTLYALRLEPASDNSGGMTRSLNPAARYGTEVEFDFVNTALPEGTTFDPTPVFPHAFPYLKLSGDSGRNELWAIDTDAEIIYRFQDSSSRLGPMPEKPASGDIIPISAPDGCIYPLLKWEALPETTEYEVAIYLDSDCTLRVWSGTSAIKVLAATGDNKLPQLGPGFTYYWRVRATEPVKSPWSETRSFTIQSFVPPEPEPVLEPTILTPVFAAEDVYIKPTFSWTAIPGAAYEFVLTEDLGLDDPFEVIDYCTTCDVNACVAREDLKYSTTYHWRVRSISDAGTSAWVRGIFTTKSAPEEAPRPVIIEEKPAPLASRIILEVPPSPAPVKVIPDYLLWVIVAVAAVLIIAVIVLIDRTRPPV